MPKCFICRVNFLSFHNLKLHILTHTGKTASSPVRCEEEGCFKGFSKMKRFEKHFLKVHSNQVIPEPLNPLVGNGNDENAENGFEMEVEAVQNAELSDIVATINLPQFLQNQSSQFISKLYSHPTIPSNAVQMVLESSESLISSSLAILQSKVNAALNREGGPTENDRKEVDRMFSVIQKPFAGLESEYKHIKFFTKKGIYIPPEQIAIGRKKVNRRVKGQMRTIFEDVKAAFIPLRESLKLFFQYSNVLAETLHYMNKLYAEDDNLSNIIQGSTWRGMLEKLRETRPNDIYLPVQIFCDDFNTCNPLGTKRTQQKLTAIYATVPCLPITIQSSLNSFFVCLLFKTKDRRFCKDINIYEKLIAELNFLHGAGIPVRVGAEVKQLFFVVALISGDNLGVNQVLGFVECFVANYPCRICRMHKLLLQKSCVDDPSLYRNPVNYDEDLQREDTSATGVKTECVWNRVEGYHCTSHTTGDLMHDILESAAGLDIIFVLNYFIDSQFFTREELTIKIAHFDYGIDNTNRPPDFTDMFTEDSLSLSSSESLVIIRYLPVIIGSLIPRGDEVWDLFLLLREIVDLVMAPYLQKNCSELLRTLIEEHHKLYLQLTGRNLTFKQHMMTHYPHILLKSGPMRNIWCMRMDGKHCPSKRAAAALICRRNVAYSVAKKHQLRFAHFLNSSTLFHDACEYGPSCAVDKVRIELQCDVILSELGNPCFGVSWVKIYGTRYKPSMMLFYDFVEDLPCFAQISEIIISEETPHFLCRLYETVSYDRHFCAYHVRRRPSFIIFTQKDLVDPLPLSRSQVSNGDFYVTLRYKP